MERDDVMLSETPDQQRPEESNPVLAADMSDDTEAQLPAHIAARFYRTKLNARRKSSAASSRRNSLASSRRNSLSSAHSHASRSRGPQSTYVAQHLRRASIIESRRARLADRAAHVEQVRIRAALAKNAPRGKVSTTEERAVAAQLAKEKYLAKVAAACAEEVARAKRIAEEVKERKLAEETRQRLEMEEKHAEAEKRRAEYQRNLQVRRARRADSAEKKLAVVEEVADADENAVVNESEKRNLDEEGAARRIERAWSTYQRQRPVLGFQKLDITSRRSRNTTFEDMSLLVNDPRVMSATTSMLIHLGLQTQDDPNAELNTRTFLSAFMIVGHPVDVLSKVTGTQETDLITKATELVALFESAVARLAPWNRFLPNPMQLETLSQCYTAYTSAFAAWRLQDSSVLIEIMVASFVELDKIWQAVKDDTRGHVSEEYRKGIRDNQVTLLSRIRKLAGAERADTLIKKAIRESRRNRPRKRPAAEVKPRIVEGQVTGSQVTEGQGSETTATQDESDGIADTGHESADQDSHEGPYFSETLIKHLVSRMFSPMPANRVVTHELAIDKDYRLSDQHAAVRQFMLENLPTDIKAAFESGNGNSYTLQMAANVRDKLLRMTRPGTSHHRLISETLDLGYIQRQCARGIFSYQTFFEFMADLLPKLCAPFRDQAVLKLTTRLRDVADDGLDEMIGKLILLLDMIDKLNLDYQNFMLMSAAPTLIQNAAAYEEREFKKSLEAGIITTEKTQRWWNEAHEALINEVSRRDPENWRDPADMPTKRKTHTHALIALTFKARDLSLETFPETLSLDHQRLQDIRKNAIRIAVLGAILLTTKNLLRRDVRSHWKHEAARLWQLLRTSAYNEPETPDQPSTVQKAFSILETAHNMPQSTKETVMGTISRLFTHAHSAIAADDGPSVHFADPILKLLMHRLVEHITARLSANTDAEHVRAASSASEKLAASGMAEFGEQVKAIVETLENVRRVDWESHKTWYL